MKKFGEVAVRGDGLRDLEERFSLALEQVRRSAENFLFVHGVKNIRRFGMVQDGLPFLISA